MSLNMYQLSSNISLNMYQLTRHISLDIYQLSSHISLYMYQLSSQTKYDGSVKKKTLLLCKVNGGGLNLLFIVSLAVKCTVLEMRKSNFIVYLCRRAKTSFLNVWKFVKGFR